MSDLVHEHYQSYSELCIGKGDVPLDFKSWLERGSQRLMQLFEDIDRRDAEVTAWVKEHYSYPEFEGDDMWISAVDGLRGQLERMSADNERLRGYIDLCADKFGGNEMPFDPEDTGLMSAINPEGDGDEYGY